MKTPFAPASKHLHIPQNNIITTELANKQRRKNHHKAGTNKTNKKTCPLNSWPTKRAKRLVRAEDWACLHFPTIHQHVNRRCKLPAAKYHFCNKSEKETEEKGRGRKKKSKMKKEEKRSNAPLQIMQILAGNICAPKPMLALESVWGAYSPVKKFKSGTR
jgi:hypothetical protein